MGLSATLSNALSGLSTVQDGLDVVSRNISNSGTPGYNQETLSVTDQTGTSGNAAVDSGLTRAFDQSLQSYFTSETSDSAYSNVTNSYLNQVQSYLGTPSDATSLSSVFNTFESSLSALTASPDDYSTRATVVSNAQALASTLNGLTTDIQGLRQQTNQQIASDVNTVNASLQSLVTVNQQLQNLGTDSTARAALEDQRDQLVTQVAGIVDVNVTYNNDGSVSLATRSGVTLLGQQASTFAFSPNTNITANSQISNSASNDGVGTLTLTAPNGTTLDVVQNNVLQSGELSGLLNLRDNTLVQAQNQLDTIAGSLAQSFSTNQTAGTAATSGAASGFSVDLSNVQPGNGVTLNYSVGGQSQTVNVVDVTDSTKLPMDYVDSNGNRTIGVDFSGGAASVASQLQAALGGSVQVSGVDTAASAGPPPVPASHVLTVLNNGTSNTAVNSLVTQTTSTGTQDGGLGFSLFVDNDNTAYTGSLDGQGQQLGFAGRISVNADVVANNDLLVENTATTPIGDVARVNYVYGQLDSQTYGQPPSNTSGLGGSLSGTVSNMISQMSDFQGAAAASAQTDSTNHSDTMGAITTQMTNQNGVNVNDQMAQLVQLQAAYSANAHVVSVVQTLFDTLEQAMGP